MCTAAGVLAYTNTHVLLGYNASRKRWESLGGAVEKNESSRIAACREFVEESCCLVCDFESIKKNISEFFIEDEKSSFRYRTYFFKSNIKNENITAIYNVLKENTLIQPCYKEMAELRWVPIHDIESHTINHAINTNCINYIKNH